MICDSVHPHEQCREVVVLEVQSGPGGARILYAVFDRKRLHHATPFLARLLQDRSVEVSTLDARSPVPGEVRFVAFPSLDGLPHPFRNAATATRLMQAADVPAVDHQQNPGPLLPPPVPKKPRPDPKTVKVTVIRRRKPRKVTPKTEPLPASPVNQVPIRAVAVALPASDPPKQRHPARTEPQRPQPIYPPEKPRPLTNMALAFQKLASSDPAVENLLISGFRPADHKR